jgi:hypothetical protein
MAFRPLLCRAGGPDRCVTGATVPLAGKEGEAVPRQLEHRHLHLVLDELDETQ